MKKDNTFKYNGYTYILRNKVPEFTDEEERENFGKTLEWLRKRQESKMLEAEMAKRKMCIL